MWDLVSWSPPLTARRTNAGMLASGTTYGSGRPSRLRLQSAAQHTAQAGPGGSVCNQRHNIWLMQAKAAPPAISGKTYGSCRPRRLRLQSAAQQMAHAGPGGSACNQRHNIRLMQAQAAPPAIRGTTYGSCRPRRLRLQSVAILKIRIFCYVLFNRHFHY